MFDAAPDTPAVVVGRSGEVVTHGELEARSQRLAQLLHARGCAPATTSPSSWRTTRAGSGCSGRPCAAGSTSRPSTGTSPPRRRATSSRTAAGEQVEAVVQPADPAAAGPELEAELIAHCRAHLAGYKCPRSVDFVDELPRLPTGKLLKRELRRRYRDG